MTFSLEETVKHISTDQNWQDECTVYWFTVGNNERPLNDEQVSGKYAISDSYGSVTLLDCDGCPIDECNDHDNIMDVLMPMYTKLSEEG